MSDRRDRWIRLGRTMDGLHTTNRIMLSAMTDGPTKDRFTRELEVLGRIYELAHIPTPRSAILKDEA